MSNKLQKALDATSDAELGYLLANRYFEGNVDEQFPSIQMARLVRGSANRFRMNYARVPVMALCNRIKITSVTAIDAQEAANAWLQQIWNDNQMDNVAREVHVKASYTGSAYLLVWPDTDDVDGETIDVSVCSPETTRVYYSDENPRKVEFASRMWVDDKRTRVNLYFPDRTEKYISKAGTRARTANNFEPYLDLYEEDSLEATWPIPNPYGVVPIFHFRVSEGYGRPVNRDAWEPQDAINKLTSTLMAAADYQSFPQRYILKNPQLSADQELDDWDGLDDNGMDSPVQPGYDLQSGPGGLWFLNADKVGEFPAADMRNFMEPLQQYIKAISTTTETPLHAFHGMGDAPSGESLRAANAPLNDNVRNVEGWFEPTWNAVLGFILALGGFDYKADIQWANPDEVDSKDYWDAVVAKQTAGVPVDQTLIETGYDPDMVAEWMAEDEGSPVPPPAIAPLQVDSGLDNTAEVEETMVEND